MPYTYEPEYASASRGNDKPYACPHCSLPVSAQCKACPRCGAAITHESSEDENARLDD